MFAKQFGLGKSRPTDFAFVRFFADMCHSVSVQIADLGKSFSTEVAFVGSFARMRVTVLTQIKF